MVHIDGKRAFSCQTQVREVAGRAVTTIEGLSPDSSHPLQKAWLAERVPQCGYCQSGQIMNAAELDHCCGAAFTSICVRSRHPFERYRAMITYDGAGGRDGKSFSHEPERHLGRPIGM
jgi:hypothetical protein